jgi:hypothetical protein
MAVQQTPWQTVDHLRTPAMIDPTAPTFGLPERYLVPIAACNVSAIERYVGKVVKRIGAGDLPSAVLVQRDGRPIQPARADEDQLHAALQVWVHVDYADYRDAWLAFGLPIPRATSSTTSKIAKPSACAIIPTPSSASAP